MRIGKGSPSSWSLGVLVLLLLPSPSDAAFQWSEHPDAGNLVTTAQMVSGPGELVRIVGSVYPQDQDLYCISINDPSTFSASVPFNGPTDLWLFDEQGRGIAMTRAQTPAETSMGRVWLSGALIPAEGLYLIGVTRSPSGNAGPPTSAVSLAGRIWSASILGEHAPDGPGAGSTLITWSESPNTPGWGYDIQFTGTGACDATVALEGTSWSVMKATFGD